MPVYNAPLLSIDAAEARRYAGLQKAADFDEEKILEACEDARLLAVPKGIWEIYDYDCETQTIKANPPCQIQGKSNHSLLVKFRYYVLCQVPSGIVGKGNLPIKGSKEPYAGSTYSSGTSCYEYGFFFVHNLDKASVYVWLLPCL